MKTELKYRTFDELLADVSTDFKMYSNEALIEPAELIKVAQRVNYDLGLRIHITKETIIDVEKKKAKLPDDFYVLNFALLCGKYKVERPAIQGDQREDTFVNMCQRCGTSLVDCSCPNYVAAETVYGDDSQTLVLVQKIKTEVRTYEHFERIHINGKQVSQMGHDGHHHSNAGEIRNGYIYTNMEEGQLYISYEGAMEDLDGNLLVLNHPMINEYYEYALKKRILENLAMNGEDVVLRMNIIAPEYRAARNNALSIVNTPDFSDMYNLWQLNRKAQYSKYVDMFKTHDLF